MIGHFLGSLSHIDQRAFPSLMQINPLWVCLPSMFRYLRGLQGCKAKESSSFRSDLTPIATPQGIKLREKT